MDWVYLMQISIVFRFPQKYIFRVIFPKLSESFYMLG